jgi:hypothetical protein
VNKKLLLFSIFCIVLFTPFTAMTLTGGRIDTSKICINPCTMLFNEILKNNIASRYLIIEEGVSSWYGSRFHLRKTASGERYDMNEFSAAHRTLPFGSIIRVKDLKTTKAALVRINDRGPFVRKRIVDISYAAAQQLELEGITDVRVEGFNPNFKDSLSLNLKNYYFAYSLDLPLLCIPKKLTFVIYKSKDIRETIEIYNTIASNNPQKVFLLLVPVKNILSIQQAQEEHYLIARLPDNIKQYEKEFAEINEE